MSTRQQYSLQKQNQHRDNKFTNVVVPLSSLSSHTDRNEWFCDEADKTLQEPAGVSLRHVDGVCCLYTAEVHPINIPPIPPPTHTHTHAHTHAHTDTDICTHARTHTHTHTSHTYTHTYTHTPHTHTTHTHAHTTHTHTPHTLARPRGTSAHV